MWQVKNIQGIVDVKEFRKKLGLNQKEFWEKVGLTQAGGSRCEKSKRVNPSVAILIELIYVKGINIDKVNREDMEIISYLQSNYPDLHKKLKKNIRRAPANKASLKNISSIKCV